MRAAAQPAGAADREAVLGRLDLRAEPAQALDHRRDPVRLLVAELLGAAHDRLALGEAAEQRRPAAVRRSRAAPRSASPRRLERRRARGDDRRHAARPATRPSPRLSIAAPIRSRIPSSPIRVGLSPTPSMRTCCRGRSPRRRRRRRRTRSRPGTGSGRRRVARPADVDPAREPPRPSAASGGSIGTARRQRQHALGVIAGRRGLGHRGLALGQQARQQHARLHLRARHRQA